MEKTKDELIETLGVHLEVENNLPPLAARIYAILVLTNEDGLTFDDCLEKRGAGKISVSTSLNLLLNMGIVTYFTKPGDRRRYFTLAERKTFFLSKLEESLKRIEKEKEIFALVQNYFKNNNPKKYEESKAKTGVYLNYITKHETLLKEQIEKYQEHL